MVEYFTFQRHGAVFIQPPCIVDIDTGAHPYLPPGVLQRIIIIHGITARATLTGPAFLDQAAALGLADGIRARQLTLRIIDIPLPGPEIEIAPMVQAIASRRGLGQHGG